MLKRKLDKSFGMKDLGATLSQGEYIEKVLEKFKMKSEKEVSTPFANHFKLSKDMFPKA